MDTATKTALLNGLKTQLHEEKIMTVKDQAIKMIEKLPDDATVSDIMAGLCFRQNVDAALKELDECKGISHERAKKQLGIWLQQ